MFYIALLILQKEKVIVKTRQVNFKSITVLRVTATATLEPVWISINK